MRTTLLLGAMLCISTVIVGQQTITVDLSKEFRPVTHCASGSLYGITETLPVDIATMVAPLKPHLFCQPPRGESNNQHPYGSAFAVAGRLASTTAVVQITLADLLPNWPYTWPGKTAWLAMVKSVVKDKIASGHTNYHSYTIWNEPGITWNPSNGNFYTECWKPTFDLIRSLDPKTKIAGPGEAYYSNSVASDFLSFCKTNNCLPEIFTWHQCGISSFVDNIKNYRALEISLGITPREVCINEYSSRVNDPYEGCPGYAVPMIAKFERHGIESACITWWHTQYPGRLGSLITPTNQKGGGWHLYKWYGDMTGNMVQITPPNDKSDGIDGFGCIDRQLRYASICIGGNTTGDVKVRVNNIPADFGAQVKVVVESVAWIDKDTPVTGTSTISTAIYNVANNTISVSVKVASSLYAYRVYITPANDIVPPNITITKPLHNAAFVAPATVSIDAAVSDADGTISHILFYLDNATTTFHQEWLAPYAFEYTFTDVGRHTIRAVVYDNNGNTSVDSVTIKLNVPQSPYGGTPAPIPGTIQSEAFDVGGNGFAYYDTDAGTNVSPASGFRADEDVDIEVCTDINGGYNIGFATAGEWLEYTVRVDTSAIYELHLRVACLGDNRTISLSSDGVPLVHNLEIPNTGGWQTWADVVVNDIVLQAGVQVLRLTIGATDYVNINYISFVPQSDTIHNQQLTRGWNYIVCPIQGSILIQDALASIWTHVESVKDNNSFYNMGQALFLNSLNSLTLGGGYYVKVDADCTIKWVK